MKVAMKAAMKTRMKRAMKDERCGVKSSASHGSNWKRHELSSISPPLPYSLWRHAQARSGITFATWLYSQVTFGPTRSEKLASSEEARQFTPVDAVQDGLLWRVCFRQEWRLMEQLSGFDSPHKRGNTVRGKLEPQKKNWLTHRHKE